MIDNSDAQVAVLLPCYNEEHAIAGVIMSYKQALPKAKIYVYDNNSSDRTAEIAAETGAIVRTEIRQGKGNVVRQMFSDIDADIYVLADGDGTYSADDAQKLISTLQQNQLDMVVGRRKDIHVDAGRVGHAAGNTIFNFLFRLMFTEGFTDIFSGYHVFSRRFVKSFPALSTGFEIETELSVHTLILKLPFTEVEVSYGQRIEGSLSKLSTFRDGIKIFYAFVLLMKEVKPFVFFNYMALWALALSIWFGFPVIAEYFKDGYVTQIPRWILSVGMLTATFVMFVVGLILDSVARGRTEQKRIAYLAVPPYNRIFEKAEN